MIETRCSSPPFSAIVAFLAFALIGAPACRDPTPLEVLAEEVEATVPRLLEREAIPGAAVVIAGPDGFEWVAGFGHTDSERTRAVDPDTLFSVASITKAFTATAVMTAVAAGELDLDRPIGEWLPEFTVRTRFEPRPEERMTLRLLLSHRAGLAHEAPVGNNFSSEAPSFDQHLASIPDTWLRYPVGERFAYSNLGVDVAGWVLQRRYDRPFVEVVRDRVLEPLDMTRSRFADDGIRNELNLAEGSIGRHQAPHQIPILASGGLYSSARDLARFLRFQLERGKPLIETAQWQAMHEIQAPSSEFQSSGYGLGLEIHRQLDGELVSAGHGGRGYGFLARIVWLPSVGMAYGFVQNESSSTALLAEIERLFVKTVWEIAGGEIFSEGVEVARPVACVAASAIAPPPRGAWVSRGTPVLSLSREGEFGILGGRFHPMCPLGGGRFVEPSQGLRNAYRFEFDSKGRVKRLVGLNSGTVYDYNDGPADPPGPRRARWRSHLGTYQQRALGVEPSALMLRERNGYLYFDDLRLEEIERNLFVATNGEVLDLREKPARWRNVPLRKVAGPATAVARDAAIARATALHALLKSEDPEPFLAECTEALQKSLRSQGEDSPWREGSRAPEPTRFEVDDLGDAMQVLLLVDDEAGGHRARMRIDRDDRLSMLSLTSAAPRTWWHQIEPKATASR